MFGLAKAVQSFPRR